MGMWIVIGVVVLAMAAVAFAVDLRDGSFRSRVNRKDVREGQLTSQNKAALSDSFFGVNNPGGGG